MGANELIDTYLEEMRPTLRLTPHGETALAEMEDHLLCATETLEARGEDHESAQREAITRLGPAGRVARSLAVGPQGRPALPTRPTVSGGALALAGAGMWVLYAVSTFALIHLYSRLGDSGSADSSTPLQMVVMAPWGISLVGAMVLLLLTVLVLKDRHGGFHWAGWLAVAALTVGCVATLGGWFIPGWGSMLTLGATLLVFELLRSGLAPRAATLALLLGPVLGFLVWGGLRLIQFGSRDEWGDYPAATALGVAVGILIMFNGLLGLGRWLRNEQPIEAGEPVALPAVSH